MRSGHFVIRASHSKEPLKVDIKALFKNIKAAVLATQAALKSAVNFRLNTTTPTNGQKGSRWYMLL